MDSTALILAVCAPGFALMLVGMTLIIAARRSPASRLWGKRLYYAGLGLLYVVPSVGIIVAVVSGTLIWPALLYPVLALPLGVGVLYGLRLWWGNPTGSR